MASNSNTTNNNLQRFAAIITDNATPNLPKRRKYTKKTNKNNNSNNNPPESLPVDEEMKYDNDEKENILIPDNNNNNNNNTYYNDPNYSTALRPLRASRDPFVNYEDDYRPPRTAGYNDYSNLIGRSQILETKVQPGPWKSRSKQNIAKEQRLMQLGRYFIGDGLGYRPAVAQSNTIPPLQVLDSQMQNNNNNNYNNNNELKSDYESESDISDEIESFHEEDVVSREVINRRKKKRGKYAHVTDAQVNTIIHQYFEKEQNVQAIYSIINPNIRDLNNEIIKPVSLKTIEYYINKFRKTSSFVGLYPNRRTFRCGKKRKFTDEEKHQICNWQLENNGITMKKIKAKFMEKYNKSISISNISKIQQLANFSSKQLEVLPIERNIPETIAIRKTYCEQLSPIPDCRLIFIDETGFNIINRRGRGRSKKGTKAITVIPCRKGGNITVIGAISPHVHFGLVHFEVRIGGTTSDVYRDFLEEMLQKPLLKNMAFNIVHDNASIHRGDKVSETIEYNSMRHNLVRLPPYSPFLNPIEEAWSKMKQWVMDNNTIDTQVLFVELVKLGIQRVTNEDCAAYYNHVKLFYVKGINAEVIE